MLRFWLFSLFWMTLAVTAWPTFPDLQDLRRTDLQQQPDVQQRQATDISLAKDSDSLSRQQRNQEPLVSKLQDRERLQESPDHREQQLNLDQISSQCGPDQRCLERELHQSRKLRQVDPPAIPSAQQFSSMDRSTAHKEPGQPRIGLRRRRRDVVPPLLPREQHQQERQLPSDGTQRQESIRQMLQTEKIPLDKQEEKRLEVTDQTKREQIQGGPERVRRGREAQEQQRRGQHWDQRSDLLSRLPPSQGQTGQQLPVTKQQIPDENLDQPQSKMPNPLSSRYQINHYLLQTPIKLQPERYHMLGQKLSPEREIQEQHPVMQSSQMADPERMYDERVEQQSRLNAELPQMRRMRDIFQPISTIPKDPKLTPHEQDEKKVDQVRASDQQSPGGRFNRDVMQRQLESQDPSPLMNEADGSQLEDTIDQEVSSKSEPSERVGPFVIIWFLEKRVRGPVETSDEEVEQEEHNVPENLVRERRGEPFPSVLIPQELVENKERIEQQQQKEESGETGRAEQFPEQSSKEMPEMMDKSKEQMENVQNPSQTEEEKPSSEMLGKGQEKLGESVDQGKEKLAGIQEKLEPSTDEEQQPGQSREQIQQQGLPEKFGESVDKGQDKSASRVDEKSSNVEQPFRQSKEQPSEKNVEQVSSQGEELAVARENVSPKIELGKEDLAGKSLAESAEQESAVKKEQEQLQRNLPQSQQRAQEDLAHDQGEEPDSMIEKKENLQQPEELPSPLEVHSRHQQEKLGKQLNPQSPIHSTQLDVQPKVKHRQRGDPESMEESEISSGPSDDYKLNENVETDKPTRSSMDSDQLQSIISPSKNNKRSLFYSPYYRRRPYYRRYSRYGYPYIWPFFFGLYPGYYGSYYGPGYYDTYGYDASMDYDAGYGDLSSDYYGSDYFDSDYGGDYGGDFGGDFGDYGGFDY